MIPTRRDFYHPERVLGLVTLNPKRSCTLSRGFEWGRPEGPPIQRYCHSGCWRSPTHSDRSHRGGAGERAGSARTSHHRASPPHYHTTFLSEATEQPGVRPIWVMSNPGPTTNVAAAASAGGWGWVRGSCQDVWAGGRCEDEVAAASCNGKEICCVEIARKQLGQPSAEMHVMG